MRINGIALQAAALAAGLLSASAARAEMSPLGIWIDHTGRGAVEITRCGEKLCGYVAWVKSTKDADGCGEQIIGDVKAMGGGKWDKGWIYDPDSDSKYDVELTPLGSDKLRVVGYAGSKWLSETMTWKRAPADLQKCSKAGDTAAAPTAEDKPVAAVEDKPEAKATADARPEQAKDEPVAEAAPAAKAEPETKAKPERTESKPTAIAKADDSDDADAKTAKADDEDEDEPKSKSAKHKGGDGKAIAKIVEALNVKKIDKRRCKMDVPYVDMVVTFPCEK